MYVSLETNVDYFDVFGVYLRMIIVSHRPVLIQLSSTKIAKRNLSGVDKKQLCQLVSSNSWRTITQKSKD